MSFLSWRTASFFVAIALLALNSGAQGVELFDKGDNALWMRRHWMHEGPAPAEIADLAAGLKAHGIRRIYPFLGPIDQEGWPGWRSKAGLVRYDPERAGAFLKEIHRIAPETRVMPWTGGIAGSDVKLDDEKQRRLFAAHAERLVALGADGIHLNIEPVPSRTPGYLNLLREVKAAIGSYVLSVAAYAPPIPSQSGGDLQWDLPFMREVCGIADEIAIMAYNTGATEPKVFENIISGWTREIATKLPSRSGKVCEWLMGVPAYDDDDDYHRPNVETIEHSLKGIIAGFGAIKAPVNFRGVSIYASFTMDERKWSIYDRLWRGAEPVTLPPLDPRNTTE